MRRILTAAVLVPSLWALVKLAPDWAFCAVFALAITWGVVEAYRMLRRAGRRPHMLLGTVATVGITWSFAGIAPELPPLAAPVALVVLTWITTLWRRTDPAEMFACVSDTLIPVFAIALPLASVLALRTLPEPDGQDLLVLLFVCVAFGDTAAFYVGSTFGRRRMAPTISPNKSWEGAIGGMLGAVGGALLAAAWFYQRLPWGHAVVLGVLLGALGILGDLSESMVKRALGAKDASRLLPGHGGILDRLDSVILAAPALYAYWYLFLEGRA